MSFSCALNALSRIEKARPQSKEQNKPDNSSKNNYKDASRGQIDVIEMFENVSDYKYLFKYEDRTSRYVVLKALRSNNPKEVAMKLLDVMTIIGVPYILQSENGQNFAKEIITELFFLWNEFRIISDEVIKLGNERNFKNIIKSWLIKNPKKTWIESIKLIQVLENASFPLENNKYPYESLFKRNVYKDFYHDDKAKDDGLSRNKLKLEMNDQDDCLSTTDDFEFDDKIIEEHIEASENLTVKFSKENLKTNFKLVSVKTEKSTLENSASEEDEVTSLKRTRNNHTFKCKFCPKEYMKVGHLTNHLKSHKKSIECIKCSKMFRSQVLYENHEYKCHGEVTKDFWNDLNAEEMENINHKENTTVKNTSSYIENKVSKEMTMSEKVLQSTKRVPNLRKKSKLREKRLKVNETLECHFCEQKFEFPSVLKRHIRSHTNERPYACRVCNKSFKQLGHLSQHAMTHTDYRSLQCNQCGIKFESLDALKLHSETHPDDLLLRKTLSLTKTRLFECDTCKKVFSTKSVLERHILTHTQERHFECDVCGKRFKQSGHVKSHMLVHTGERRFQCTLCPKRFSLANSLKKHMYIHNGDKPYQCDVCGTRFLEKRNLNGHLLTHTNEKPFVCKICGKKYTLADTLRRHVSAAHENGRTYQCEICAKMFKQLAHLSVHKKVHTDERPFQCHLCEKNFKHKNVLKSHLAIHANVRPFECDECKATFVRKTNLQTHIASAHMNERPYTCKICGKKFKQVSHLNGHIIVHSNSMPYQCDFCDRRCNRLDNLKKHMRIHTKNSKEFNVLIGRPENIDSKIGPG